MFLAENPPTIQLDDDPLTIWRCNSSYNSTILSIELFLLFDVKTGHPLRSVNLIQQYNTNNIKQEQLLHVCIVSFEIPL